MKALTTLDSCVICELIESGRRCRQHIRDGSMSYLFEIGYMYGVIEVFKVMKLWT